MKERKSDAENESDSKQSERDRGRKDDSSGHSRSRRVDALHRTVGNQAVQRLFERGAIQASLAVSSPQDPAEREAERVADQVMRMSDTESPVKTGEAEGVNRNGPSDGMAVDGETEKQIKSVTSGGKPLPPATRSFFEPRFGRDLSDVRVHTGSKADEAARSIDAEAFTHGQDVVFRKGKYDPGSKQGKELLAHELTHVVQQGKGATRSVQRQGGGGEEGGSKGSKPSDIPRWYAVALEKHWDSMPKAKKIEKFDVAPEHTDKGVWYAVKQTKWDTAGFAAELAADALAGTPLASGALVVSGALGFIGLAVMTATMVSAWSRALDEKSALAGAMGHCYGVIHALDKMEDVPDSPTVPKGMPEHGRDEYKKRYNKAKDRTIFDMLLCDLEKKEERAKVLAGYKVSQASSNKKSELLTGLWKPAKKNAPGTQGLKVNMPDKLDWPWPSGWIDVSEIPQLGGKGTEYVGPLELMGLR